MRPGQSSCGLLALPQGICLHKAQVPEWCTGISVLVHRAAIAMFRMAAGGFVSDLTSGCDLWYLCSPAVKLYSQFM